jgi:hypothetical protein
MVKSIEHYIDRGLNNSFLKDEPHKKPDVPPLSEENLLTFLRERALATWNSLDLFFQYSENDLLPADRLRFSQSEIIISPQTKPTNIGLGMLTILGAEKIGVLAKDEFNHRLQLMIKSLAGLERSNGFFYDWYDSGTKKKLTHWLDGGSELDLFLSSVDNAWLALALLITAQAKPALAEQIHEEFLSKMDFDFFFDQDSQELLGGYSVSRGDYIENHYPRHLLSETRIIHWANAALVKDEDQKMEILSRLFDKQGEIPNKLSGGALFELLMPRLLVREKYLDEVLGQIFDEHCKYGDDNLGGIVGLSVVDDPNNKDHYTEMGVGGRYPSGSVVSAHGAVLALLVDPVIALNSLSAMEEIPGFYDEYGYKDAVDVKSGKTTQTQIFIDQAMIFLCLVSYEDDHFAKLFSNYFSDIE